MANINRRGIPMPFVSRSRRVDPPSSIVAPEPAPGSAPSRSSMVDSAVYRGGIRVASPTTLAETYRALDNTPDGVAWIGLYRPSERELMSLAEEFNLHPLAIEDAIVAHQRPKLERYDLSLIHI